MPARIGGPVGDPAFPGNSDVNASEPMGAAGLHALEAGGMGAGAGLLYHLAKRKLLNTDEENAQEDAEGNQLWRRMALPAAVGAGLNVAGRSMFPRYINNPELRMFPGKE